MDVQPQLISKPPVIRGARACTTCRAAKMKCVGAEDGQKQCQRCKRANVECIFEKHRRGRKPGSKLSEASKMLRRLEKGLNSAKSKAASVDTSFNREGFTSPAEMDVRFTDSERAQQYSPSDGPFASNQLPPLNLTSYSGASEQTGSSNSSRTMDVNDEDDSPSERADSIFPADLLQREHKRNSFFRTILNPEVSEAPATGPSSVRGSETYSPPQTPAVSSGLSDPVSAGILDEELAKVLFDLIFLRLNPFINLFDPSLHSVSYVRNKSPFLFTVLLMAGCKFFNAELFKQVQKLANEFAVKAFQEGWKSVEVVQAFACLTYWKDPDDNRTWTFVGYACRMAVEIGLNRYVPHPPPSRNWMLPEDDFIRHADRWHERPGVAARPEDVIVAAFVQLRHIAAETTEVYKDHDLGCRSADINYDVVLRNCNNQLTQWKETWNREMQRAGGDTFHISFLSLFRLYIRLFTNSFGTQHSPNRAVLSVQALSTCYSSAVECLKIVSKDFASMSVLRYGQETITMMSAYAAVILLRLLRNNVTLSQLHEGAANEAYSVIMHTADAYQEASVSSLPSSSAAYHARFLKGLLSANDIFRPRKPEKSSGDDGSISPDPRSQGSQPDIPNTHSPMSSFNYLQTHSPSHEHLAVTQQFTSEQYPGSIPLVSSHAASHSTNGYTDPPQSAGPVASSVPVGSQLPPAPQHFPELDQQYWRQMFTDLGWSNGDGIGMTPSYSANPSFSY
ncbi:hypothetical protein D9757_001625 [Collybiopsis confluens]|uniref:Zn(2)-C6 fungal-type domain-containing protein n=1 Tax=Collybiopsis confluens TaxID=2823264 RepID=A0A8H5HYL5_9AGAR|nr:hypothetical protein D9757_001625 [Collybiopsis confluens]